MTVRLRGSALTLRRVDAPDIRSELVDRFNVFVLFYTVEHDTSTCPTTRTSAPTIQIQYISVCSPACKYATPSLKVIVLIAIHVSSSFALKSNRPTAPAYTPRFSCSRPPTISTALIFGAPETVPAGKIERNASNLSEARVSDSILARTTDGPTSTDHPSTRH